MLGKPFYTRGVFELPWYIPKTLGGDAGPLTEKSVGDLQHSPQTELA